MADRFRRSDGHDQFPDDGRQGMTDRYQGRHGGTTEQMDETAPCICPKCGYVIQYDEENPCTQQSCPNCGSGLSDYKDD